MGKDIKGKELDVGISQRSDGFYVGRFTTKYGQRKQKLFLKLQECRQWLADSQYQNEHSNLNFSEEMTIKAWFDYWIRMKKRTVRANMEWCEYVFLCRMGRPVKNSTYDTMIFKQCEDILTLASQ